LDEAPGCVYYTIGSDNSIVQDDENYKPIILSVDDDEVNQVKIVY